MEPMYPQSSAQPERQEKEKRFLGKGPDFWRAVQAMGEGFAGRGPQWQAAQARQAEAEAYAERLRQEKEQEERERMLRGAERDAAITLRMLDQALTDGDAARFQQLTIEHARALQAMGEQPRYIRKVVEYANDPLTNAERFRKEYATPMRELLGVNTDGPEITGLVTGSDGRRYGMQNGQMVPIPGPEGVTFGSQAGQPTKQKGSSVIYQRDGQTYMGMSTFDPTTGQMGFQEQPIDGRMVNSMGLTPDEIPSFEGAKASARKGAEGAAGLSTQFTEQAIKVRQMLPKYDEIVRLVNEGANTGAIRSLLPSVQQASIELDTLQKDLGIAVINSATFGALNKEELNLALSNAIPTKLSPPALAEWALRKKDAQARLVDYLEWSASVLGRSGMTPAVFSEMVRTGQLVPPSMSAQDAAGQGAAQPMGAAPLGDMPAGDEFDALWNQVR